jgi:transcriptional regulator of acetoin/glycerol metabolism
LDDTTFTEDARKKRADPATPAEHLFLVIECERPFAGGVRMSLEGVREVDLGRGAERAISREGDRLIVRVPDKRMSQQHARMRRAAAGWVLEDQNSRNGTIVAGKLAAQHTVDDGALVELGRTFFVLRGELLTPRVPDVTEAPAPGALEGMATLLPALGSSLAELARVSASSVPIMLLGATGTGKESLARAVHALSGRSGELVPVNCGALAPNLVESQLFGHVKGAFSGALRDEPGFVRSANKGTLFLDEIGDLPASSQAALLRVLQEREVVPVGATRAVKVDLRVVSATHRPVAQLATKGEFRADLLARLAGHTHVLLPLASRREDVGVILAAMIAKERWDALTFTPDAMRALLSYTWPLNARELQQCIARAVALAAGAAIDAPALPPEVAAAAPQLEEIPTELDEEDRALKDQLLAALVEHKGNVSQVARAMNKARTQVQRWLHRFRLDPDHFREG